MTDYCSTIFYWLRHVYKPDADTDAQSTVAKQPMHAKKASVYQFQKRICETVEQIQCKCSINNRRAIQ